MATEPKPIVNEEVVKPDPNNLNPLEAFYHLFTIEQHPYESEEEYRERQTAREVFITTLEDNKLTPSDYLAALQSRYGN